MNVPRIELANTLIITLFPLRADNKTYLFFSHTSKIQSDNSSSTQGTPGMDKKDVNIEIKNNVLTISGEKKYQNKDSDSSNFSEFSYGQFSRSFNLPEDVKNDNIKASMKNGILALEIPRIKEVKSNVKKISIK